ncbi:MAG: hypothetical protein FWE31_05445 [Firmicutes bacterium]|nr:hypothetical protein [Bacillota bacterium]
MIDLVEFYLSRAELFYSRHKVTEAIEAAETALTLNPNKEREIALKLFIARALSHKSEFEQSNKIYRNLIDEATYLPPIILGILHNNLQLSKDDKSSKNLGLMKIYMGNGGTGFSDN